MHLEEGFPLPFIGGGKRQRPWWRIADIEAWKAKQAAGTLTAGGCGPEQRPDAGADLFEPPDSGSLEAANDLVAPPMRRRDLVAQLVADAGG